MPAVLARLHGVAGAALVAAGLLIAPAWAAQPLVPHIVSFGPYKLGMSLDQAKDAHKGGKLGACGDIAPERQCLVLDAAVFEEPGVIHAVLDVAGAKVDRIVVRLDPQRTQRRAYRCVRLSEKVFALLVVVYGSEYKQSYDQDRRPLPAVAWDGELSGRLIFEAKCRTADEGNPRISVVAHRPEGIEPPGIAEQRAPKVDAPVAAALPSGAPPSVAPAPPLLAEAPAPVSAPVGVVEQIGPDTSGAVSAEAAMAVVARELTQAKGKRPAAPAPEPIPSIESAVAADDPDELPEPPDLVAPEPFMMPEEEALFRKRREAPSAERPTLGPAADAAPVALLAAAPSTPRPQRSVAPVPAAQKPAVIRKMDPAPEHKVHTVEPVMTGGWRHRAPVPPAKPWRERMDAAG